MKSFRKLSLMAAVVLAAGTFAAPGRAMAADRWSFGFSHEDHGSCFKSPVCDHDKDCHEFKSVPEIDPNGLTAMGTILAGGIAMITARRRRIM